MADTAPETVALDLPRLHFNASNIVNSLNRQVYLHRRMALILETAAGEIRELLDNHEEN